MCNIIPTAYFPSILYLSLFIKRKFKIEIFETFRKQSCRTRCTVLTANGLQTLSVPVVKVNGNHTLTRDIRICYNEPWQQIHRRCIESAYRKSPYFEHYFPYIEDIFSTEYQTLIDLNDACLKALLKILKKDIDIKHTDNFTPIESDNDLRTTLSDDKNTGNTIFPKYYQVFSDRHGFVPNLSILDLIFNEGTSALSYLENITPDTLF